MELMKMHEYGILMTMNEYVYAHVRSMIQNTFKDLEPSFRLVREAGLKVSIHCGEIPCSPDSDDPMVQFGFKETRDILAFRPDRLGHALLLTDEMYDDLETIYDKIPIESCPTSNVMTLELATHYEGDLVHGLRQHPRLKRWIDYDYPVSISTDDPGIFNTNPTTELILLVEAFQFENPWKIVSMMINSVDHIFETDEFKLKLKETLTKEIQTISKLYVKM
jgi:adenosine deaminase